MPKKIKEKQRPELMEASSSDDEDSDVERNFTLLSEHGGGGLEAGNTDCDEEENSGPEGDESSEVSAEEEEEEEKEEEEEPGDDAGRSKIRTAEDMKKELSNMSFEDIMMLQKKVGTKVYSEVVCGSKKKSENKKKRLNKNRPMEVSSKRPAPFLRQVIPVKKPTLRDPRFDDLSGEYKAEIFDKTYRFIEDIKSREKQVIQKKLKKIKNNNQRKEQLQFLLKRMENQEREKKRREQQREREIQFKRQQREQASQGARPFFLKKSDKKKLQLAERYEELKKSGKLENFLSKKRKRNAGKDRRKLPRNAARAGNSS